MGQHWTGCGVWYLRSIAYLLPVADLEGGGEPALPPPLERQTDAVAVLMISDNGTALWRRHRPL